MEHAARLSIAKDLAPSAEDVAQVRAGLMAFNEAQAGSARVDRFAVYVRDAHDTIQGGLVGFLAWQWMSVEWLWVDNAIRGQGYGSALLREAESLARDAGCVGAKLDTYEFQAKPFYEKHGYSIFGVLEGYPANTRTYYMQKAL
jgi:GNAT superfamily N-acetyltransferase